MKDVNLKVLIKQAFDNHILMRSRNKHTINELLYVLAHDKTLNKYNCNITVNTLKNEWFHICGIDVFVDINTRGIWFNDDEICIDVEEVNGTNEYFVEVKQI